MLRAGIYIRHLYLGVLFSSIFEFQFFATSKYSDISYTPIHTFCVTIGEFKYTYNQQLIVPRQHHTRNKSNPPKLSSSVGHRSQRTTYITHRAAMPPAVQFNNNSNTHLNTDTSPQPTGLAQEYYDQSHPSTLYVTAPPTSTSTPDFLNPTQDTDRCFFSSNSSNSSQKDKSKKKDIMDKGVNFVVKRIEKKMNKQSHGQGAGEEVQAMVEEQVYGGEGQQAYGAEASGQAGAGGDYGYGAEASGQTGAGSGGDYGYGAATEEYGYPEGLYDHIQGSGIGEVDGGGLAEAAGGIDWGEVFAV